MKKNITLASLALNFILVLVIVLMRGCSPDCPPVVNKGSFPVAKPDHVTITPETVKSPVKPKKRGKTPAQTFIDDNRPLIDSLLADNQRLQKDFETAADSLKAALFANQIAIKAFSKTWQDDQMKLTVTGVARGEVMGMSADWEFTQTEKRNPWRIIGKFEIGSDIDFSEVAIKPGIMFQSRKGQIFSASVDSRQRVWIGAGMTIFESK